jgi:hypothetical protein
LFTVFVILMECAIQAQDSPSRLKGEAADRVNRSAAFHTFAGCLLLLRREANL